jgi:hypothetical protein
MKSRISKLKALVVGLSCGAVPLITEVACDPSGAYFFRDDDDYYYDDYYFYEPFYCDPFFCW